MENRNEFSFHEQHFEMMPTSSAKTNSNENLGTNPFLNGKSCNQYTPPPPEIGIPTPTDKNKKIQIDTQSTIPQTRPFLPILAPHTDPRLFLPLEQAVEYEMEHRCLKQDSKMDMEDLRRKISNRIASHRSRMKKVQYVLDMEKSVQELEEKISVQKQQIESIKRETELLFEENCALQNQMKVLSVEAKLGEEELEKKKNQIMELQLFENIINSGMDLSLRPPPKLYPTISFYEDRLQKLKQASTLVKSKLQIVPNFSLENNEKEKPQWVEFIENKAKESVTIEDDEEDEDAGDIDQYLNFDETIV